MAKQSQQSKRKAAVAQPPRATAPEVTTQPVKKWRVIILVIVSFLAYANTCNNGFALDDSAVIQLNTIVSGGVKSIPHILATPYHEGFFREQNHDTAAVNDLYRPLSLAAFAIEHQFFDASPGPYHFFNIVFFAGCVIALLVLLQLLFGSELAGAAFAACLLFAVHPIHTEVVANIKSQDELLCFLFATVSLIRFCRYAASGKAAQLLTGAGCLFLSLMSKETSISFLAIIPFVLFTRFGQYKKRNIQAIALSAGVALVYMAIRYAVLNAYNADSTQHQYFIDNQFTGAPSAAVKIATALLILGRYLKLLVLPYPLSCDYSYRTIPFVSFNDPWVWVSILLYAALVVVGVNRFLKDRKDPYAFAIAFSLTTLALFSNIIVLIGATMAERFLFFPSAGFCLAAGLLLNEWIKRMKTEDRNLRSKRAWCVLGPVCAVFTVMTAARNRDWKDSLTLFRADVAHYPGNSRLWNGIGTELTGPALSSVQDTAAQHQMLQEGANAIRRSLQIYSGYYKAHNDLGNIYVRLNRLDSAETELKEAARLAPQIPVPVSDLGALYFREQRYPQALECCKKAQQISPGFAGILNNMAMCYLQMKEFDSAMTTATRALASDPGNTLAKNIIDACRKAPGPAPEPEPANKPDAIGK